MLGHLRPYMGFIKRILAWPYLAANFTPTQVGVFGVFLSIIAVVALRVGLTTPAFWLATAAVLSDMADGEVARVRKLATPLGNYLDAVLDRTREGILLFGLISESPNLVGLALLGTFLTSFAKARTSLVIVTDNRDWPGLGDHADRAVMILVCYALPHSLTVPLAVLVLSTWSCFLIRLRQASSMIAQAAPEELLPYLRDFDFDSDLYQRTK